MYRKKGANVHYWEMFTLDNNACCEGSSLGKGVKKMKVRVFLTLIAGIALAVALTLVVAAQGLSPHPTQPPESSSPQKEVWRVEPVLRKGIESAFQAQELASTIPLGKPGTVYSYDRVFGETEVPYLEDNVHFYDVEGVGTDGTNIWISDSWGDRVLKFNASGGFLQKIGKAGVIDYTGTSLDYVADVAVDNGGNI